MTPILELSNRKFKIPMSNIWRALMDKVDNMQEQMDNTSRKIEILRRKSKVNTGYQKY